MEGDTCSQFIESIFLDDTTRSLQKFQRSLKLYGAHGIELVITCRSKGFSMPSFALNFDMGTFIFIKFFRHYSWVDPQLF